MVFGSAVVENENENGKKAPVSTKRTCISAEFGIATSYSPRTLLMYSKMMK